MEKLDIGTFGNSPACVTLVKIMNDKKISANKVGRQLANFNRTLHELEKIDREVGLSLAAMSYKHYKQTFITHPEEIISYAQNVLSMYYKKWLIKVKAQKHN